MRTSAEIRRELAELADQRTEAWKELSVGHDPRKAEECRRLSEAMNDLWLELRHTRLEARFGPRDQLIAKARAEARLEDELNRRISGRPRARRRRSPARA
jgi:hypothetical protein